MTACYVLTDMENVVEIALANILKIHKSIFPDFHAALKDGNFKSAQLLMHELKNLLNFAKEEDLAKMAAEMETTVTSCTTPSDRDIAVLEKEFLAFAERIPTPKASTVVKTENKELAQKLTEQLIPLLKDSNVRCLDYIDELNTLLGTEAIVDSIDNFEFETALSLLLEWAKLQQGGDCTD